MKLVYCPDCQDVFKLRLGKMRRCECGKVKGRYIDNSLAEVTKNAISIAIGNGALLQAIANMSYTQWETKDAADRKQYIEDASIGYAWVRPNEGPGNPHTKIIDESKNKEIVYVRSDLFVFSNSRTKQKTIDDIAENLDMDKFMAVPALHTDKGFLLTDGNHRVKAAMKKGVEYIPTILLSKEEFDYIAYSKTHMYDFTAYIPEMPRVITKI